MGWLLAVAVSGSSLAEAGSSAPAALPARISVQIDNPILDAVIKVTLDGDPIFNSAPNTSTASNIPVLTSLAGSFLLKPGKHMLVAEVLGQRVKASLNWTPLPSSDSWVVIHFVSVAPEAVSPPYLTFSLQPRPYKLR